LFGSKGSVNKQKIVGEFMQGNIINVNPQVQQNGVHHPPSLFPPALIQYGLPKNRSDCPGSGFI
jgi:hypothetical protein